MTTPTHSTPPIPSPPITFLTGTWYVNHSTLPMWKDKRNVRITYTALPSTSTSPAPDIPVPRLDDLVEYQTLTSDKLKTVHGVDTPTSDTDTSAWDWRGKGWLKIASSHWEFLDWSGGASAEEAGNKGQGEGIEGEGEEWAVIWFQKTIFTPEGIDIFSRRKEGLGEGTVREIKERLRGRYGGLSEGLFEVRRD